MANVEGEKLAPKITRLPLPNSDSPLVIDLPDGQKIVVGKMTDGSVIEVATWRGVGRPDSRTSRLMLGVGNGNVNEVDEDEEGDGTSAPRKKAPRKPDGFAGVIFVVQQFFSNFKSINWAATFKALLSYRRPQRSKKSVAEVAPTSSTAPEIAVKPVVAVPPKSSDDDIEAWLDKVSEKAARSTSKSRKPAAKKAVAKKATTSSKASSAKKAVTTKKAAPKTAKKR